ncbi:DUF3592 domain-containing protein [Corallococcus terminator]|uniref:DUF3592 domain-containing protein n=1 Tax=Corallococcus terminator TaxID=2316733 RepID=A0A3A8JQF9_9BACT|nr:DUF3592 domain-containing protein [Corallococcus terminator]RKG94030.1 hypothetical protein D7V88_00240 [Corallococcus terminator]
MDPVGTIALILLMLVFFVVIVWVRRQKARSIQELLRRGRRTQGEVLFVEEGYEDTADTLHYSFTLTDGREMRHSYRSPFRLSWGDVSAGSPIDIIYLTEDPRQSLPAQETGKEQPQGVHPMIWITGVALFLLCVYTLEQRKQKNPVPPAPATPSSRGNLQPYRPHP